MRLLYLAHRVPYPPTKGDKIRAFHELRALAARGHEVHLFAFADDPADLSHRTALENICHSVTILPLTRGAAVMRALASLPSREPLSVRYFSAAQMHAAVSETVSRLQPDALVVYSSTMAQYVPSAFSKRTLVDLVDVDSEKWQDYSQRSAFPFDAIYRLEARRLRQYEMRIVRDFAQVLLTTRREADLLGQAGQARHVHALVNGVDCDYFQPAAAPPPSAPTYLSFTGAMDYRPNVDAVQWFANEVWPLLAHIPDLRLSIAGSRPVRQVRRLGERTGIEVSGTVPDIRPFLQRATVAVAPLRIARGVQNKVLEAMACGLPVVATPLAVAALDIRHGTQALVAETPREFADAVIALLASPRDRAELGAAARSHVEQYYRWDSMLNRFCDLVEALPAAAGAIPALRASA